jgi:hypothetical protein
MNNNYQMSLFGEEDSKEPVETIEVSFFCRTCGKGSVMRESPPIMTAAQRIENGFVETSPGKWHKQLDGCSRQCESKAEKSRGNEKK